MKKLFVVLAAMLTFTSTAFAQLGSLASDLVYTPVTPCRIFDTRISQGGTGPIAAGGTKNFSIWGVGSYAGQGGAASNCGITANLDTAAVAVNFTVVTPATPGFITAFPFGVVRPQAATVNFIAGDVVGNYSVAKNAQSGLNHLSIYSTSNVEVVGDVVGYYARPVATALQCIEVAGPTVTVAASDADFQLVAPACTAGYTLMGINFSSGGGQLLRKDGRLNYLYIRNSSAASQTATPYAACCRVPGR